jgi:hypothetical protein
MSFAKPSVEENEAAVSTGGRGVPKNAVLH